MPAVLWDPSWKPVAARATEQLPAAGAMGGGCRYEPKWDGFRCVSEILPGEVRMHSRHGKDLARYFPDISAGLGVHLPAGTVVDGELVCWRGERLDFSALSSRVHPSPAVVARRAAAHPAHYVVFDLVAAGGRSRRAERYDERRRELEELSRQWPANLVLCPMTEAAAVAEVWFADYPAVGCEGLVIKAGSGLYRPGRADWLKLRARQVYSLVVGATAGEDGRRVVLGGYDTRGRLRPVGISTPVPATLLPAIAALPAAAAGHPWHRGVPRSALGRLRGDTSPVPAVRPVSLIMVVDVAVDVLDHGHARHPIRVLRLRPDLDADQVEAPGRVPELP